MFVIVGLGNPGTKYARTRHNAGFDTLEILADKLGIRMSKLMCKALVGEGRIGGERVALCQPQTFMNLSGESVVRLLQWYKIEPPQLIVCYDDIDLPPGKLRVRAGGSAGTHNGMRSIIFQLGRDDFPRVRVGIGSKPPQWELADYVTSRYETVESRKIAFDSYVGAAELIETIVRLGVPAASQRAAALSAPCPAPEKPSDRPAKGATDAPEP